MGWFVYSIGFLWVIFVLYWLFSAIGLKQSRKDGMWWKGFGFRLVALGVLLLLLRIPQLKESLQIVVAGSFGQSPVVATFGVLLCALGIGIAIWARVHLGRNWGQPMTMREKPDLITTGPYAYVRHPIYTGIGTALLGTALVAGWIWLFPFFAACLYYWVSAKTEEKNMTREFPKGYPPYMQRTKMFVPGLI